MSIEARQRIVRSTNVIFTNDSQKSDLLNVNCVRTEVIALLIDLITKGHILEITAIKSDHHDDSGLGKYCHAHGAAFDCWPLIHRGMPGPSTWAAAESPQMITLIRDAYASKWRAQVGLAGSADNPILLAAAGFITYPENFTLFRDTGDDHVHIGAQFPLEVPHL